MNAELKQLAGQSCVAGAPPLEPSAVTVALKILPGWQDRGGALVKRFPFGSYRETITFVNAVAGIAEAADHHPELWVRFADCEVRYFTHSAGAITRNDLICAARIEGLAK